VYAGCMYVCMCVCVLAGKAALENSGVENKKSEPGESSVTSSVQSVSVNVAVTGSEGDRSSVSLSSITTQPLPLPPPPPPPPPSSVLLPDPALVSHFPPLPPPPVERLPVRFQPRHVHPDVRWRFDGSRHPAMFPRPFHPAGARHPFNFPHQFIPVTQRTQTPFSGTVSHQDISQTEKTLKSGESSSSSSSPSVILSVSETVSSGPAAKSSGKPIVKDFKVKGAPPRFVPRQLHAARTAGSNSSKILRTPDPVIEELKQNAFVLSSKVQGPSLPQETERKRKAFQMSETGNESLDKTVHAVRQKVSRVSANIMF